MSRHCEFADQLFLKYKNTGLGIAYEKALGVAYCWESLKKEGFSRGSLQASSVDQRRRYSIVLRAVEKVFPDEKREEVRQIFSEMNKLECMGRDEWRWRRTTALHYGEPDKIEAAYISENGH